MELTMKMDATPEEFFERIEKSLIADIRMSTGKSVPAGKLNGYKYKKVTAGKKGLELKVKIKSYRRPEHYEARFTSAQGTNTISYRVTPTEDGGITVDYAENFSPSAQQGRTMAALNDKVYDFRVRHRAKSLLKSIAKDIKQARKNGITEVVLPEELTEDDSNAAE